MTDIYFEAEMDSSTGIAAVGSRVVPAKGTVIVGLPDGSRHVICGGEALSTGIGFKITDGLVEIRLNESNDKVFRTYGTWLWVEGDEHRKPRGFVGGF